MRLTKGKEERVERQQLQSLVDALFESYVSWREACADVRDTYDRWRNCESSQRTFAFEGYREALDHEERAARRHSHWVRRLRALESTT